MIISVDDDTFGEYGKYLDSAVVSTVLTLECDECHCKQWNTSLGNYIRHLSGMDLCQSCRNRLWISGFGGRKHSDEFKSMMSEREMGDKNPSKRIDVRKKISDALRGRKVPWITGKKRPEHSRRMKVVIKDKWDNDDEFRKKLIGSQRESLSGLHIKIKEYISSIGLLDFESEVLVGYYRLDEVCHRLMAAIEVQGRWWHGDWRMFGENDLVGGGRIARSIWARDRNKKSFLNGIGYSVCAIWEDDWNNNQDGVSDIILNWIGELSRRENGKDIINADTSEKLLWIE